MDEISNEELKERERSILLRKMFNGLALLRIGRELGEPYCCRFNERGYDEDYKYFDEGEAASSVANLITDTQIQEFSKKYESELRSYWSLRGGPLFCLKCGWREFG